MVEGTPDNPKIEIRHASTVRNLADWAIRQNGATEIPADDELRLQELAGIRELIFGVRKSGLLSDEGRVKKLKHSEYTRNRRTDVENISRLLDEITGRLESLQDLALENWTTEDFDEVVAIKTILTEQLPRVLVPIGAPDQVKQIRDISKQFTDLFSQLEKDWAQVSEEMAPKQFVPTARQARAYAIIEELNSLTNDTPANVRKVTLARAKRLRRNKKGLRPYDIELFEEAYAAAKRPAPTPVMVEEVIDEPINLSTSSLVRAALEVGPEYLFDEGIDKWARRNKVDDLKLALQIRLAVKDIDFEGAQLAKRYEQAGDDQLEIMKQLFKLTMKRIGHFPSSESFTFHLALLLGRMDGKLNKMDEDCVQALRQRHTEQTRKANEAMQAVQLITPENEIDPDSAWGGVQTPTTTQVRRATDDQSDTVVDAPITQVSAPQKGALPKGQYAPSPSLDNDETRKRAIKTRKELMSKAQTLKNRRAIFNAAQEELTKAANHNRYNRRAWGAIVSAAASAFLFVAGAMGLNQETDTESKADQNPSAQSFTDAGDAPELSADALDAAEAKVEVPENSEDLNVQTYTNLWDAAGALHPNDSLVAKNIAVATVADAVNTNALTELALGSLPSGYTAIQDSSCASYSQVGAMLDCVSTQFNQSVSDQVAGELVFNGFVNPEIDFDPLATAVESLNSEEAQEKIINVTEELQEKQVKHPEWFGESQDVASPDTVEKDDAARASLNSEPVKVDKPSLEQRARGWWRSAKKKVSSFFA